jgi:hypothetical protein
MSTLWHQVDGQRWQALAVGGEKPLRGDEAHAAGVELFRYGQDSERGVGLLVRPGVRALVNGHPVLGGFRILEHKDEILVAAPQKSNTLVRLFFSCEATPRVAAYRKAPGTRAVSCPVCRGAIRDGEAAVQCPNCARWFHQIEPADGKPGRRCWTFAERCRICNVQPTALSGGPVWSPEKDEELHV